MIVMVEREGSFFLDTSTQINKNWEDDKIKLFLSRELSQKYCYSSVYVKNEYKYRILNDSVKVYNTIVSSDTLKEAESRLNATLGSDSLPYKVFKRYFRELKLKERVLKRIEQLIDSTWQKHFGTYIKSDLFDLIECKHAQNEPSKRGKFYLDITEKCPSDCNIGGFLSTRQSDLKLLNNIDTSKLNSATDPYETLRNTQKVSGELLNGALPNGDRCKTISDSIISIEARDSHPGIIIHSMDSDLKLLCEVLKIPACVHLRHEILNIQ